MHNPVTYQKRQFIIKIAIVFNNVYVSDSATVGGLLEKQGPLGSYLDNTYDDLYCGCKTFEQAEQKMLKEAIDIVLKKTKFKDKDILEIK